MSTKKEIAHKLLQNWSPWDKIKNEAGDGSGTYEELRLFLDTTAKQTYEDTRTRNKRLIDLKSEVDTSESKLATQKMELTELKKDMEEKHREHTRLTSMSTELKKRNQDLQTSNRELIERGVDDEIIKMIRAFDHRDRSELVQRIETITEYDKLGNEMVNQKKAQVSLFSEIEKSRSEQTKLEEKISELKEETRKVQDNLEKVGKTAKISELAVNYGYSPTVFENLLKTIENYLEISSYKTNAQVLEALQEYQNMEQIKEETIKATKENEVIRFQLLKTRGDLEAIKNETLETIQQVGRNSLNQLETQKTGAEKKLIALEDQQKIIITKAEDRLQKIWYDIEMKNTAWETKLRELAKYELLLKNSLVLSTAYYNPNAAKDIPLQDISRLAQVVDYWVQHSLQGVTAQPSSDVANTQGFTGYTFVSVTGLSRFLSEELNRRVKV